MNRRDELAHLDKLAELMRDLKLSLRVERVDLSDPLWQTHMQAYADNALELIAEMREDVPPARSPGKREPEPLVFAPPKRSPERPKKGEDSYAK